MKTLGLSLIFLSLIAICFAGEEVIEFSKVRKANTLGGLVTDQLGSPLPGVTVCVMSDDWRNILGSTITDQQGRWLLQTQSGKVQYRIRLDKPGFHQVRFQLKLVKKKTANLTIELPVAT